LWKWSFGDGKYSTAKNPSHTLKQENIQIAQQLKALWVTTLKQ
jgi:hypothetical protein